MLTDSGKNHSFTYACQKRDATLLTLLSIERRGKVSRSFLLSFSYLSRHMLCIFLAPPLSSAHTLTRTLSHTHSLKRMPAGGYQVFAMGHGSVSSEIKGKRGNSKGGSVGGWQKTLLKIDEEAAVFRYVCMYSLFCLAVYVRVLEVDGDGLVARCLSDNHSTTMGRATHTSSRTIHLSLSPSHIDCYANTYTHKRMTVRT